MRLAQLSDNTVINIIEVDTENIPDWAEGWPDAEGATIGSVRDGEEWIAPPDTTPDRSDVAAERDRRLSLDFEFGGVMYQRDTVSVQRIAGAAQMAALAIGGGAQPGDLFWHGGAQPFGWIASDDTVTPMDAQTVVAFGMAAAARETLLVFAARDLRQMQPIPTDFSDDRWWP